MRPDPDRAQLGAEWGAWRLTSGGRCPNLDTRMVGLLDGRRNLGTAKATKLLASLAGQTRRRTDYLDPAAGKTTSVRFTDYSFGSVRVDGVAYDHDLIIDCDKIRKRKKAASRRYRDKYGHTPLSAAEDIPWRCRRLVIGTGADGKLPVMTQVYDEARRQEVDLVVLPTAQAIGVLTGATKDTNAILHLTC